MRPILHKMNLIYDLHEMLKVHEVAYKDVQPFHAQSDEYSIFKILKQEEFVEPNII